MSELEEVTSEPVFIRSLDNSTLLHLRDSRLTPGLSSRYQSEIDLTLTNNTHASLVRMVGENKRVLELGAASGYMTRILRDRGCNVTAVEYDSGVLDELGLVADGAIWGDLNDPAVLAAIDGPFDVVLAGDVLEHLLDPLAVLRASAAKLAAGGRVVLSIPNVGHADLRLALLQGQFEYRETGLLDATHIKFFTYDSLMALLADAHLMPIKMERTLTQVFESELAVPRESVSEDVLAAVLRVPESLTYQFVVTAIPKKGDRDEQQRIAEEFREAEESNRLLSFDPTIERLQSTRERVTEVRNYLATAESDRDQARHRVHELDAEVVRLSAARDEQADHAQVERKLKQDWSQLAGEYERAARTSATLLGSVNHEIDRLTARLRETQFQFQSEAQRAGGAEAEVLRLKADEASAGRRALAYYRRTLDRAAPWGTHRKGAYLRLRAWSGGHKYVRPPVGPGPTRVPPLLTSVEPLVSVVICVHGRWEYTARCLASIAAVPGTMPFEVIVVDDASTDDTAAQLTQVQGIRVISLPKNLGFLRAANAGMAARLGRHVLLLNNDTEVTDGWLDSLVQVLDDDPLAGVVGAQLVYPDGRLQEAGGIVFNDGSGWNVGRGSNPDLPSYGYRREVDYCSGAALLVRDSVLASTGGGFDERFAPAYYEDTDLCFQARAAGFRVIYQPRSRIVHHEGVSHGTDETAGVKVHQAVNQDRFVEKWSSELKLQSDHHESSVPLAARRGDRPICLVIDHEIPKWDEDSGSLRMASLLEILVKDGYDVTFLAHNRADSSRHRRQLQDLGIEVLWGEVDPWAILERYSERLCAVVLSRAHLAWDYLPMVRRTAPNARLIYDTVDLHHVREERRARLENNSAILAVSAAIRELELSLIRSVDVTLVVSESEQEYLREITPDADVRVVSNVHRPRFLVPSRDKRHGLVFVGGFRHPPNVDAVQWFVTEVFPVIRGQLPDVVMRIVGSSMPPEISELGSIDGIEIVGWVEDLAPILDRSRVSVAPLRYGAGVKGKVVEAMVNGLPVVTTSAGAEGIAGPADGALLIADDAESFAASVVRLYTEDDLWEATVRAGRHVTVAKFGPTVVGQAWLEAIGKH